MTGRISTLTVVLTLSASLASADQARQRWPGSSSSSGGGSQSSGSQGSGGQSSGSQGSGGQSSGGNSGGQSAGGQRSAGQSSGGQSSGGQSSGGQSSGGSQLQRWGQSRAEARQATPPSPPRQEAPAPAPRQESGGGNQVQRFVPVPQRVEATPPPAPRSGGTSQLQRWGTRRNEETSQAEQPVVSAPRAPSTPFFTTQGATRAVPRQPQQLTSPSAPPMVTTGDTVVRSGAPPQNAQRVAQPRQRVPDPLDQQVRAVPRGTARPAVRPDNSDDRVFPRARTRVYNNYYYYPRQSYPYGYGSYGLGYFYYDPYAWYDTYPDYYSSSYSSGIYQYPYGYATGEIRLQVRPRHAEVYVDGYFAGRVDEFDGFLQALRIEEGPHTIEIVAPGYQPLVFDVRIIPGRKIDYRGSLLPY